MSDIRWSRVADGVLASGWRLAGIGLAAWASLCASALPARAAEYVDDDGVQAAPPGEGARDIEELDLADLLRTPVVESATGRKQSLYEAPGSLTVFESDEIVAAGITSIADLLRRVPGMHVMQVKATLFATGMRGLSRPDANGVVVFVDGRRASTLNDSPFWENFPLHPAEIERIEILRGPGTTMYGADALNGVINIVSKRPLDHPGVDALFAAGNTYLPKEQGAPGGAHVAELGNGVLAYGLANAAGTLGARLVANWNHVPNWVDPDPAYSIVRNGDFGYHLGLSLDWRPSTRTSLYLDARHGHAEGARSIGSITDDRVSEYTSDQYATVDFRRNAILPGLDLTVNADVHRTYFDGNAFSPTGGRVYLQPLRRSGHLLAQADLAMWGGRNTLSLGGDLDYIELTGVIATDSSRRGGAVIVQNETRLWDRPRILLNLGARAEQTAVTMTGLATSRYFNLSPRASLIARITPRHTIFLAGGSAYRIPNLWEAGLELAFAGGYAPPVPPVYLQKANPALRPEQVRSLELGYRGRPLRWLRVDAVGYYQVMLDHVGVMRIASPVQSENGPEERQAGVELGLKLHPHRAVNGHVSYAATSSREAASGRRTPFFPEHMLAVGGDVRPGGFRLGVDFNYVGSAVGRVLLARADGLVEDLYTTPAQPVLNLRAGRRLLDGRAEVFAMAANLLALGRARSALDLSPTVDADPYGAIFLAGVRVSEGKPGGAR